MKTNVPITLTDAERSLIANQVDRKESKRLVTRSEVVALCQQFIGGLIGEQTEVNARLDDHYHACRLYDIDPEDNHHLRGRSPGHVRGWNLVKRAAGR